MHLLSFTTVAAGVVHCTIPTTNNQARDNQQQHISQTVRVVVLTGVTVNISHKGCDTVQMISKSGIEQTPLNKEAVGSSVISSHL
jgi:hypothetical protein